MKLPKYIALNRYQLLVTVFLFWGTYPLIIGNSYLAFMGAISPKWRCESANNFTDVGFEIEDPESSSFQSQEFSQFSSSCSVLRNCSAADLRFKSDFYTFAEQYDLLCDFSYWAAAIGTLQNVGFTVGCVMCGQLADAYGRKRVALACMFGAASASLLSTVFSQFALFCTLRTIAMIFVGGLEVVKHAFLVEVIDPHHRMFVFAFFWFSGGTRALLAGLLYFTKDWRVATQIINIGSLVGAGIVFLCVQESEKWLTLKYRYKELRTTLTKINRINGLAANSSDLEERLLQIQNQQEKSESRSKNYTYFDLFKHKSLIFRTLVASYFLFAVCIVSSGFDFSSGDLSGDFITNQVLIGVISQILKPVAFFLDCLIPKFNRRWLHQLSMGTVVVLLATTASLMAVDVNKFGYTTAILAITGRIVLEYQWDAVYLYAVELFPTVLRASGMSFALTVGRGGDALAPIVAYLGHEMVPLPFFIYAVVGGISVLISCAFAPDTKGKDLPDTIELEVFSEC